MSPITRISSFLLIITLSLLVLGEATATVTATADKINFGLGPRVLVDISNKLPNRTSFTIHCKSKNDDLGTHVVLSGQKYEFRFRVDFFGTTLFFCGAKWHGGHVVFDIYKADRDDMYRCPHHCRWEARGDAIVGYMEHYPNPDIVIPWNK